MRIVRYLKQVKGAVTLIVLLLVIQAFADLSLPRYTSDLVDVGIQQRGIQDASPQAMREETFDLACMMLAPEDEQFVRASYEQQADGSYALNLTGENDRAALNEVLAKPLAFTYFLSKDAWGAAALAMGPLSAAGESDVGSSGAGPADAGPLTPAAFTSADLLAAYREGTIAKDQVLAAENELMAQLDGFDEALIEQQALVAVRAEYEALGIDTGSIQMMYLAGVGLRMLGVAALMMLASIGVSFVASRAAARVAADLRRCLFERVVTFSDAEVQRFSAASLITRGTNDIQQIQMFITMLLRMVLYAPILALGGVFMISRTDVSMSWIIALAIAVIAVVIFLLMVVAMPKFKVVQQLIDRVNLVSREMLTGLPVIRAFDRQQYEEQRFDAANTELMRTQLFTNRVMTFMMPTMMLVLNAVSVLIVWVGGHAIDAGALQTGDMIAFITYAMVIIMSFLILGMMSVMMPRALVAAQRVDEVLQTESSIKDPAPAVPSGGEGTAMLAGALGQPSNADAASAARAVGADAVNANSAGAGASAAAALNAPPRPLGAEIAFKHVSFAYDETSDLVLEDVSFTARAGKTTAIVGSTGSGKSTIIKLIERFYDVKEGSITLDGVDVRALPQHVLRANLGYVPQKAFLFRGTIESAITCGDESIDRAAVERAAAIAQASDFIAEKEGGFAAEVSQGGANVSGGQRQRLAIARALATNARAFLFDDSFSALDYKTDALVRAALNEQLQGRTVIMVAQRISTVLHADSIVVLEDGKVVGQGTHEHLLATCSTYREIAESQLSAEELGLSPAPCDELAEGGDAR